MEPPVVRFGLLGTAFMGRAHSRALAFARTLEDNPAAVPVLQVLCGRNPERLEAMRQRYGWRSTVGDWRQMVSDASIDAFDNAAPNHLHAEPTILAAKSGKHVLCEKPLGRTSDEARMMLDAAQGAGVVHMCAFNYRFFPAVQLARQLLQEGRIGEPLHFRSRFLLSADPNSPAEPTGWRADPDQAGGVVGDLLSHHIDLARHLVGEPIAVSAITRPPQAADSEPGVEDSVACLLEFASGAIGTLEATNVAPGHALQSMIEIDGSAGTLTFDVRLLNELRISSPDGTTTLDATASGRPWTEFWWPRGQGIGWADSFVHELRHFVGAVTGAWEVGPVGATFADGYRCALVCDAILRSAEHGRRESILEEVP